MYKSAIVTHAMEIERPSNERLNDLQVLQFNLTVMIKSS